MRLTIAKIGVLMPEPLPDPVVETGKSVETFDPTKNPSQVLAYDSEAEFLLMKGGQRSGKSVTVICKAIKHGQKYPGIKVLITRKVWKHLYDTNYSDFRAWCPTRIINKKKSWKSTTDAGIVFNNGTVFEFRAYSEEDIQNIRGHEYGLIIMSEANQLSNYIFEMMLGRLSQTTGQAVDDDGNEYMSIIPQEARRIWIDTNPGGHDWIWKRWDREHPNCYDVSQQDAKWFAVRFRMEDNKAYLPPGYIENQKQLLSKRMWDRYGEGLDEPFTGLVFDNFDRRIHVLNQRGFIPPSHWPVWVGLDYGKRTNTHATWICVTEDQQYIVFKEYVARGKDAPENAKNINQITAMLMMSGMGQPLGTVIDPSTDQSKGESKLTVFQQLKDSGLSNLRKGKRETGELAGMLMVYGLLTPRLGQPHPLKDVVIPPGGTFRGFPRLYFCEDCPEVIAEFEEWRYPDEPNDEKELKEKPEERNDHGIDSCRYALGVATLAAGKDPLTLWIEENSPKARNLKIQEERLKKQPGHGGNSGWQEVLHTDLL